MMTAWQGVALSLILQWTGVVELGMILPLALAVTSAGYAYCAHLAVAHQLDPQARRPDTGRSGIANRAVLLGIITAAVFWAVGLYATRIGTNVALEIATGDRTGAAVVLYAVDGIELAGPGVLATPIDQAASNFRYATRA
jgi:hypothetical protein